MPLLSAFTPSTTPERPFPPSAPVQLSRSVVSMLPHLRRELPRALLLTGCDGSDRTPGFCSPHSYGVTIAVGGNVLIVLELERIFGIRCDVEGIRRHSVPRQQAHIVGVHDAYLRLTSLCMLYYASDTLQLHVV